MTFAYVYLLYVNIVKMYNIAMICRLSKKPRTNDGKT